MPAFPAEADFCDILHAMKREKNVFVMKFDSEGRPVWPKRPERTPERLEAVRFLDELRSGTDDEMPRVPLACVVYVKSCVDIPLANERYSLATVTTGEKGGSWKVAVYRGTVKPRTKALFFSADAALPVAPRFNNPSVATFKTSKYRLGSDGVTVIRLRPHVKRHIYRLNCGLLYPLADFPELKGSKAGADATAALNVRSTSTLKTLVAAFARRKLLASRGGDPD